MPAVVPRGLHGNNGPTRSVESLSRCCGHECPRFQSARTRTANQVVRPTWPLAASAAPMIIDRPARAGVPYFSSHVGVRTTRWRSYRQRPASEMMRNTPTELTMWSAMRGVNVLGLR